MLILRNAFFLALVLLAAQVRICLSMKLCPRNEDSDERCSALMDGTSEVCDNDCYFFCGQSFLTCNVNDLWHMECKKMLVTGCTQADRTFTEAGEINPPPPVDLPTNPPSDKTGDGPSHMSDDRSQCSPSNNAESLCPDLMATTTADCECYHFCDGNLLTCDINALWHLRCDGALVMGCIKTDRPATTNPLSDEEKPVDRQQCAPYVSSSADDRCSDLMKTTTEDCECYNFCEGQFFSCDDDKVWSTTCKSELVMGCVKSDLGEDVDTLGNGDTPLINRQQCSPTTNADAQCPGLMQGVTQKCDSGCYYFCGNSFLACSVSDLFHLRCGAELTMGCVEEDRNVPSESKVTKLDVADTGNDSGALGPGWVSGLLASTLLMVRLADF